MKILKLITGRIRTNTYVVVGTNPKECIVIDTAGTSDKIEAFLAENKLTCKAILLTHEHFDHCYCVAPFQKAGAKVYAHKQAKKNFENGIHIKGTHFDIAIDEFTVDYAFDDGEILDVCGHKIEAMHTPGHTSGSVCYKLGDVIFSGDTLFNGTIGRTDLPTGSYDDIIASIKNKLLTLEGDYKILPGHEAETSLLCEKANNKYLR